MLNIALRPDAVIALANNEPDAVFLRLLLLTAHQEGASPGIWDWAPKKCKR